MKNYLSVLSLSIFFISCDKEPNNEPQLTKTQLITRASWKYDNAGMDADRNGTIDYPAGTMVQACVSDNILTLNANGTGDVDEGPTKCDTAEPQNKAVTWSFSTDETILNINGGTVPGISGPARILALTTTALSLSRDTVIAPFGNVALIVHMKH